MRYPGYSHCLTFSISSPSAVSSPQSWSWCSALEMVQPGCSFLSSFPMMPDSNTSMHFPHCLKLDKVPQASLFPAHWEGNSGALLSTLSEMLTISPSAGECMACTLHAHIIASTQRPWPPKAVSHHRSVFLSLHSSPTPPKLPLTPQWIYGEVLVACLDFWLVFWPFIISRTHEELLLVQQEY